MWLRKSRVFALVAASRFFPVWSTGHTKMAEWVNCRNQLSEPGHSTQNPNADGRQSFTTLSEWRQPCGFH